MLYFITSNQHNVTSTPNLVIKDNFSKEDYSFILNLGLVGVDFETNGLDAYKHKPLLFVIGNPTDQYVIDCNTHKLLIIELLYLCKGKTFLGQNLKFDYKFAKVHYKYSISNIYDTMIAEQRIIQGYDLSCSLDAIVERRLKLIPKAMDKQIRLEFVGKNPDTFRYSNRHIEYAAEDIVHLEGILIQQSKYISMYRLSFLLYYIEFPLIQYLAEAELEGFVLNTKKWLEICAENVELRFNTLNQLDNELRNHRDNYLTKEEAIYLTGGKYDRVRQKEVVTELEFTDLFGEINPIKPKKRTEPYVNYGSNAALTYIFSKLKQPMPTKKGLYSIPTYERNLNGKEKLVKDGHSYTTAKGTIETYLLERINSPITNFVKLLIKLRKLNNRINTFGKSFIDNFLNPVTNKVHTVYRQCQAVTSRLQSGDADNGWYNSQNIPRDAKYRSCFGTEKDYLLCTTDLSSAEAVIMIDKAQDERFYKLAILDDDAHSPLATAVWRAIYRKRYEALVEEGRDVFSNYDILKDTFVISKTENTNLRTAFKPMTFGSIYGMRIKKTAKTLNVSDDEAKIALNVIRKMIPKTFRMVETNARTAIQNGFLILNTRTNSRIWYPAVITALKNNTSLDFMDEAIITGSAKNSPIQGTQADMVKEMIVVIGKAIKQNQWDAVLVKQVHDELVYKFHKDLVDFPAFVKQTMIDVGNRYLNFIKISAEQKTDLTWTK